LGEVLRGGQGGDMRNAHTLKAWANEIWRVSTTVMSRSGSSSRAVTALPYVVLIALLTVKHSTASAPFSKTP
jgi:hypothetical protein